MQEIFNTLLVSCIPAFITGVVTYLTASRNEKNRIASLQESNKHEIEKLMRQHEVDIEQCGNVWCYGGCYKGSNT